MAFSSNFFLFCFLPIVLALYYAARREWQNTALLIASLTFYAFDSGWLVWLLLVSILLNHIAAHCIAGTTRRVRTGVFIGATAVNLLFLLHYKYTAFFWSIGSDFASQLGMTLPPAPKIALPIGISFFTFQAISYIADVYTGYVKPAGRLTNFGMYHSLFPQLIAGPIVRYVEIEEQIYKRRGSIALAADGAFRICIGLGKKLIIADTNGRLADAIFSLPAHERTAAIAWLGILAYTLQIYFDFSGYSDMAIGLGKLFGFRFPENFNLPYRSHSITEFWRRWHMTLSRWLRDYVYIPLGGSRCGEIRTYRNLIVVFFLCGLWHGAGWTFVLWGFWHGGWLVIERLYRNAFGEIPRNVLTQAATLCLVMLGWVLFRSPDLTSAGAYFRTLFGANEVGFVYYGIGYFATPYNLAFVVAGLVFALGPFERFSFELGERPLQVAVKGGLALVMFVYSAAMLAAHSFNPFIYFRF